MYVCMYVCMYVRTRKVGQKSLSISFVPIQHSLIYVGVCSFFVCVFVACFYVSKDPYKGEIVFLNS